MVASGDPLNLADNTLSVTDLLSSVLHLVRGLAEGTDCFLVEEQVQFGEVLLGDASVFRDLPPEFSQFVLS